MNKLLVRLVASGLMTVTLGAGAALADNNASIELTGPDSTNIVSGHNFSSFNQSVWNNVWANNWNHQWASSGSVRVCCNTKVWGGGLGSGNASNFNSGVNNINIWNSGAGMVPFRFGGSGGGGTIFLTGPDSFNKIATGNHQSFNSTVRNNVSATNFNSQSARSGNVTITGNTLVTAVGGSGNASNFNQAANNVGISNSQPTFIAGNWGPTGHAVISTTGPGSFNSILGNNSTRVNLLTSNNVNTSNVNNQTAQSGSVTISHNTVVSGVGGSGDATNENSASNGVDIQNN
jgi:hypothetical protein